MWRTESVHERGETEYLDEAIARVENDFDLLEQADALLDGVASQEPLIDDALKTPQTPPYHTEGPYLRHHLRLILAVLYALNEEKLHLIDIEEFRRLQTYWGEFDELEEVIKEHLGRYETFALVHDAAKWSTIFFDAPEGSRGYELGFRAGPGDYWSEVENARRPEFRKQYLNLFETFKKNHPGESPEDLEAAFYAAYRIEVHYPGHDKAIHAPVYRRLLERIGRSRDCSDRDIKLLELLIAHHLDPLHDFNDHNPAAIERYVQSAQDHGFDADDYIDALQACVFLDLVCGSKRRSGHGFWHDPTPLVNFLRSQHDYAPWRRVEKEQERKKQHKRKRNEVFKKVGLDGFAMMELLDMDPGPEFGEILQAIQAAVAKNNDWPDAVPDELIPDLEERRMEFEEEWSKIT
jgi:hypothetical protein